ncbi:MAG: hypothetical protein MMC23_008050 [Stictis urceolatum]|nr:hypothetical protein [Stictis urceolata]
MTRYLIPNLYPGHIAKSAVTNPHELARTPSRPNRATAAQHTNESDINQTKRPSNLIIHALLAPRGSKSYKSPSKSLEWCETTPIPRMKPHLSQILSSNQTAPVPEPQSSRAMNTTPKRMRLGTRSCAECRRRRVRCVFPARSNTCVECAKHGSTCEPQSASSSTPGKTPEAVGSNAELSRRLEELEALVRNVHDALGLEVGESRLDGQGRAEFLSGSGGSRVGESEFGREESVQMSLESVPPELEEVPSLHAENRAGSAPLPALLREALVIEHDEHEDIEEGMCCVSDLGLRSTARQLRKLMPSPAGITQVLKTTQKYWALWPLPPPESVEKAREFVVESIESKYAMLVAKGVLWFALCVQQLPADIELQRTRLPDSISSLVKSYLKIADTQISVGSLGAPDFNSLATVAGLECYMLQFKLYINSGQPRKAWQSVRKAMNTAVLMGLHNRSKFSHQRHDTLWRSIWQADRQLSLILGLPYGISEFHPGIREPRGEQTIPAIFMHKLSIICGHVCDRDQNYENADYSLTLSIERELEECKASVPIEFWDAEPDPSMGVAEVYGRQVMKIYYCQILKMLHIPYMLKTSIGTSFEHSRVTAVHASREMYHAYQALRELQQSAGVVCDLMDFQVFSAAIVIVINLISSPSLLDTDQVASDWELVQNLIADLDFTSKAMECNVAAQAARLLEYLSMAAHGIYDGTDGYSAVIPYFGRVKVKRLKNTESDGWSVPSSDLQSTPEQFVHNTVEFNANPFMHFSQDSLADYLSGPELGVDWTAAFDTFRDYEWSQMFDNMAC